MNIAMLLDKIFLEHAPMLAGKVEVEICRVKGPNVAHALLPVPRSGERREQRLVFRLEIDERYWKGIDGASRANLVRHEAAHFLTHLDWLKGGAHGARPDSHGAEWLAWARKLGVDLSVGIPER